MLDQSDADSACGTDCRAQPTASAPAPRRPAPSRVSSFYSTNSSLRLACQVDSCKAPITHLREYYQRYRVCEAHSKMDQLFRENELQRFCQQCGRFQPLGDFDGARRSCRERLARHSARRRIRLGRARPEDSVGLPTDGDAPCEEPGADAVAVALYGSGNWESYTTSSAYAYGSLSGAPALSLSSAPSLLQARFSQPAASAVGYAPSSLGACGGTGAAGWPDASMWGLDGMPLAYYAAGSGTSMPLPLPPSAASAGTYGFPLSSEQLLDCDQRHSSPAQTATPWDAARLAQQQQQQVLLAGMHEQQQQQQLRLQLQRQAAQLERVEQQQQQSGAYLPYGSVTLASGRAAGGTAAAAAGVALTSSLPDQQLLLVGATAAAQQRLQLPATAAPGWHANSRSASAPLLHFGAARAPAADADAAAVTDAGRFAPGLLSLTQPSMPFAAALGVGGDGCVAPADRRVLGECVTLESIWEDINNADNAPAPPPAVADVKHGGRGGLVQSQADDDDAWEDMDEGATEALFAQGRF